jgi:hypothetical protein
MSVTCLECSVCLCDIQKKQPQSLPCGHIFHKMCVKEWTDLGNSTCPLCRVVFPVPQAHRAQNYLARISEADGFESVRDILVDIFPNFHVVIDEDGLIVDYHRINEI